jgi:hypothetical protein
VVVMVAAAVVAVAVTASEKVSGKIELPYYWITDEYVGSWQERAAVISSLVFVKRHRQQLH